MSTHQVIAPFVPCPTRGGQRSGLQDALRCHSSPHQLNSFIVNCRLSRSVSNDSVLVNLDTTESYIHSCLMTLYYLTRKRMCVEYKPSQSKTWNSNYSHQSWYQIYKLELKIVIFLEESWYPSWLPSNTS